MDILLKNTSSPIIWTGIILILIGFSIFCAIDIFKNSFKEKDYITWITVVLLVPILGPFLYIFIGRKRKLNL
ncbi:PLDc N-terminal domain-containing protein [Seonamhaeicola maritimus]|uniref:Cardiolipin synthase N-terminal domain-containing protein n=1 Tax=Seonamhaeicola maritimus TaxID=2591822 RepID=A0A5C7GNS1_9FLAO|nr:hypothetical protein FUA22_07075 [Seonamhaeicola maritimus]